MKRHRDPGRRSGAARHISFGFGIHLCVCHRLAEMQPRVLREEIPKRGRTIEVVGEPERVPSNFVPGYSSPPARVRA